MFCLDFYILQVQHISNFYEKQSPDVFLLKQ